ncbi:MAG: CBS domain-containing protein [Actinobacteria bacterium]|nr:CBS domain-containing protein [Actinomycetota bacterium]
MRHKQKTDAASVITIAPSDSVTALLDSLAVHNIGAVVAVEGGRPVGIVSERDIVRRIAERGRDVLDATVDSIMTRDVVSCGSGDSVDSIAETMTERRIRHMPVIDGDVLVGIVSIGDVVSSRMRQLEHDRGQLEQYISG